MPSTKKIQGRRRGPGGTSRTSAAPRSTTSGSARTAYIDLGEPSRLLEATEKARVDLQERLDAANARVDALERALKESAASAKILEGILQSMKSPKLETLFKIPAAGTYVPSDGLTWAEACAAIRAALMVGREVHIVRSTRSLTSGWRDEKKVFWSDELSVAAVVA